MKGSENQNYSKTLFNFSIIGKLVGEKYDSRSGRVDCLSGEISKYIVISRWLIKSVHMKNTKSVPNYLKLK